MRALRKHVVEGYPDPIAQHSVCVLGVMDFTWLDEFLTGIPLEQVSEEDRPKLVSDLSNLRTERSRGRLLLMTEAGWEGTERVNWPMTTATGSLPSQPPSDEWDYNPHTTTRAGHQLYPDGDPRGQKLISLAKTYGRPREVELAKRLIQASHALTGDYPNLDFGLAVFARALSLSSEAPIAIFALGRTLGWIAHATEQYADDELIRPRARYIGPNPENYS